MKTRMVLVALGVAAMTVGCAPTTGAGAQGEEQTISYAFGGVVEIAPPDTLTVEFDEDAWAFHTGSVEGWGGDASLAWADTECQDMGGSPDWHDGQWMACQDVDY